MFCFRLTLNSLQVTYLCQLYLNINETINSYKSTRMLASLLCSSCKYLQIHQTIEFFSGDSSTFKKIEGLRLLRI